MNGTSVMTSFVYPILELFGVDRLFRYLNKNEILILAYHGITRNNYGIQPHTLLSAETFEKQVEYVSRNYTVMPLKQVVAHLAAGKPCPKNTAVITFDDGYRNNLTEALPILKKYQLPATVFVTAGYVGGHNILPLDEVYLIITGARGRGPGTIAELGLGPLYFESDSDLARTCGEVVSVLKQYPVDVQRNYVKLLKQMLETDGLHPPAGILEDFYILSPDELRTLSESELIDIGAHTVNHQILTTAEPGIAAREIADSKVLLEKYIGKEIGCFAYPNGRATDFNQDHVESLKKNGYLCSVMLASELNSRDEDVYRLKRMCVGHDFAPNQASFALKISGFNHAVRSLLK